MGGFECFEALEQPIVFAIANFRRRIDVIFTVVEANLVAEPGDLFGDVAHGLRLRPI